MAFGGAQAHIAIMLREFVEKRRYVTEEELIDQPLSGSLFVVKNIGYKGLPSFEFGV